jgi:O-antigen biosynthesis protein
MPMVSILIRSMDRESLAEALDSVALQTYPNIEVVVVAARPDHRPLPAKCGPFALRLLQTDTPLPRSRAANQAMAQAHGKFLLFLDDDDWLMPGHIARLAHVLIDQPHALAAYTGISLVDADGRPLGQTFDLPFDAVRQMAGNLTPIHAVLFSSKVLERGCRFDEALDRYEDWDFWLQLARLAPLVHLPGVSGAYRIHDSSGVHVDAGPAGAAAGLVYQKWAPDWTPQQIGQMMQRVWSHPELEAHLADTNQHLADTRQRLADTTQQLADTTQRLAAAESELAQNHHTIAQLAQTMLQQQQQIALLSRKIDEITGLLAQREHDHAALLNSSSWRITRPLRWLADRMRARPAGWLMQKMRAWFK